MKNRNYLFVKGSALCLLGSLAVLISACQSSTAAPEVSPSPAAESVAVDIDTTLALVVSSQSNDQVVVDLLYQRSEGNLGPRAAELWLQPSATLQFVEAEPLQACTAAQRTLVTQPDSESGLIRVVIYGTQSLEPLDSGPVARFRFTLTDPGGATLEILDRPPLFAPAEANTGLRLPMPLEIGGS